jgi:hypothetical protein
VVKNELDPAVLFGAVTAFIPAVLLVAFAWKQSNDADRARREATEAIKDTVMPVLDCRLRGDAKGLEVSNIGNGAALDIGIVITIAPRGQRGETETYSPSTGLLEVGHVYSINVAFNEIAVQNGESLILVAMTYHNQFGRRYQRSRTFRYEENSWELLALPSPGQ